MSRKRLLKSQCVIIMQMEEARLKGIQKVPFSAGQRKKSPIFCVFICACCRSCGVRGVAAFREINQYRVQRAQCCCTALPEVDLIQRSEHHLFGFFVLNYTSKNPKVLIESFKTAQLVSALLAHLSKNFSISLVLIFFCHIWGFLHCLSSRGSCSPRKVLMKFQVLMENTLIVQQQNSGVGLVGFAHNAAKKGSLFTFSPINKKIEPKGFLPISIFE